MYKFALPTRVIINVSNVATGGILLQKHEDGKWHPVAYQSSLMSKEERNYPIYDQEMLALIRALEDWRHFLEGLLEPFEVHTDHKNMEWWLVIQSLDRRQAQWSIYLNWFNFEIKYIKGKMNPTDVLSRSAIASKYNNSKDNQGVVVLLSPMQHQQIAAVQVHFILDSNNLANCIKHASAREAEVIEGLCSIDKHAPCALVNSTML